MKEMNLILYKFKKVLIHLKIILNKIILYEYKYNLIYRKNK